MPLFLFLFASSVASAQQDSAAAAAAEYIGAETCAACHEDIAQGFGKSAHAAISRVKKGKWKDQECETCHGPGSLHAESAEPAQILGFGGSTSTTRINQSCLACHQGQETQRGRLLGAHDRNSLNCVNCHSVHGNSRKALLTNQTDALCSSCHISQRAAFNRPFNHRLPQGGISCVNCHNPHGGAPPSSLARVSGNEPSCAQCHADKRGPFPFEHAPVRLEPCSTCHEPHGSANPRMMTRHNVAQLCLECHTTTLGRLAGNAPASHDLRTARFQNCTVCHSRIHGSYVNRDFLR